MLEYFYLFKFINYIIIATSQAHKVVIVLKIFEKLLKTGLLLANRVGKYKLIPRSLTLLQVLLR
jgi:hypothetical protein